MALDDEASAIFGVAGLASVKQTSISLSVRQNYLMKGLGYAAVGLAAPSGNGAGAVSLVNYGNVDYNEQQASLCYALPLGHQLSMAAALHYLRSATSDAYYTTLNRVTFSLAVQYRPSELLTVGFRAYNPVAVAAENDDAVPVPALFNIGVSYWLRDELLAVAEVEKNLYRTAMLRVGLQYLFHDNYFLRIGLSTNPFVYCFGAAMQREHLGADVAMQLHQILGLTSQLSLHYRF